MGTFHSRLVLVTLAAILVSQQKYYLGLADYMKSKCDLQSVTDLTILYTR